MEPLKYEEYEPDYVTITENDDDCLRGIREAIRGLPFPQRKVFLMYSELGTYSAVAKLLRCSVPTVSKRVREIKKIVLEKIDSVCTDF